MSFIFLFGLYLSAYYPLCGAQAVEEEGCPSFVTIHELTTLLGNVLHPDNGPQPNIIIEEHYINCLSVGSILGYIRQATYTVRFTDEPGNNGPTLAQVDLICVQNVQQGNRFWQLGSFNSYNKIINMSDAILLATNDTILTDCSRCNVPNHPNFTLSSSNDDQLRHCQRCPNECLVTNLTLCYGTSPSQCCNVYINKSCAVQCPTKYSASHSTNFKCEFSPCQEDQLYCSSLDKCLSQDVICDGCADCIDDKGNIIDEKNCTNRKVACTEGEVRLLGGPDKFSGILTVCVNGALTLVCEEYFEYREANVICRQAGFIDRAGLIVDDDTYIADIYNFPFALGGLLCNGSEDNISKCNFHSDCAAQPPALPGSACCSRDNNKFIAMSCIPSDNNCTDGDIRLVGGSTSSEGIVEMCLGGHYGYICQGKDSSDDKEGILTCEQLGYDPAGALPLNAIRSTVMFGESSGPPIVHNPDCDSSTSLLDCVLHDLSNDEGEICDDFQLNFGVHCDDIPPTGCKEGDIRLVTRFQEGVGFVQICFNNTWYMLCRDTFGSNEAEVVCTQLGYVPNGRATQDGVSYPLALPKDSLSVKLDLSCVGDEKNITDCITVGSEPAFVDQCKESGSKFIEVTCPVPPVVGVFPMSKDGNYTLEVGRFKRIQCVSTTPGYVTITKTNKTGSFTTIDYDSSFADDDFISGYETVTSKDAGFYTCNVTSTAGFTRIVHINITVLVPEGPYSEVFVRFSGSEVLLHSEGRDIQTTLDFIFEPTILNQILVEESGIQTIECVPVTNRSEDLSRDLFRVECSFRNYPPINNTLELAQKAFVVNEDELHFVCPNSIIISDTGFCDYQETTDPVYGNYAWIETFGGNTVSTKCVSKQDSNVIRKCLNHEDGWGDIDFTACRSFPKLPIPYSIYIRFSANFTFIAPSGTTSSVLDNIRITIELALPVETVCKEVSKRSGDIQERVECRVNGTSTQQITASNPGNITEIIFSALRAEGYIVQEITISDNGFCDAEIQDTSSPNRGQFMWKETAVGMTSNFDCPFGPSGEVGTRTCLKKYTWGASEITSCGTIVTQLFRALNSSLSQINITTDNVVTITNNLTTIVSNATDQADQNEENLHFVLAILTRVVQLFTAPTTDVKLAVIKMVTIQTVEIVDDVEEWLSEVIQPQANQIIHIIENITQILFTHPNFTNITIQAEDIVIRMERAKRQGFTGRTFVVDTLDNGNLNVGSDTDLIQNQTSSISVPPTIASLLNDSDITLAFIVYRDASLFPVRRQLNISVNVSTLQGVIGSQVASMAIPGIPFGTTLPEPVNITLRLTNPNTGTAENISNPVCVFWDFGAANGAGNWSTSGCRTITDDIKLYQVVCECDHLTNFACLVDISARTSATIPPLPKEYHTTLEVVTYVGVFLSLIGLLITIMTYLIFKKLRTKDVSMFHIQLCLALMFMLIVFVAGIDKTSHRIGCIITGVLIHYFTLAAVMWMGAEAVLIFQKLVIVFDDITWRYLLIVSIICWALPVLPVIIAVGIDVDFFITTYENSTNRGFCFIGNQGAFFGAFLVPIFLVLIFNFIIYIVVIGILIKRTSNEYGMTTAEAVKLLLSSFGIMCLFGLTWLFAVFTFTSHNAEVSFALQFVFAFFNVFQGFYIFLFFVVLSRDARRAWRGLFCKCLIKENSPSTYKLQSSKSTNARADELSSSYSKVETKSKPDDHARHHDNIELEEEKIAEQEMELCVKIPPNNKPNGSSNENEWVNGSTDKGGFL